MMHPDDMHDAMATPAEAHAEWHANLGIPMYRPSFPACPMDCAAGFDGDDDELTE